MYIGSYTAMRFCGQREWHAHDGLHRHQTECEEVGLKFLGLCDTGPQAIGQRCASRGHRRCPRRLHRWHLHDNHVLHGQSCGRLCRLATRRLCDGRRG